ncbi:MAG: glycosyltransferase [Candidatus Eisenbacteria bacterium]|uniref:Glycosyltransferase n=1 Tax=Eiseniibacteriota bacterium TaxID=2212470 RepID=A0A933W9Z4_UNCEI|nr:glycosyltransferase [Candidatus Eisenbacteria bacterium]
MTTSFADTALAVLQAIAGPIYVLAQGALVVYTAHRWTQLRPAVPVPHPASPSGGDLPVVTVQLPVYDEPLVVERLIEAAASLDWPAERLEIQVLDDSDDETVAIAAAAVARLRACGVDVTHVRRGSREGFKAGALAHGLVLARGSLVAVFDADFVPPREFLRALVPHFADPRVGLAQARWGHLNRGASALTEAQAVMLDAHFRLEHAARARAGLFLNFNGTAGLWRRACIESAGGWSHDTLTEDLDLSYRAQLAGWRFVYDDALVVPAELPSSMTAFLSQQRRWAKGSIQTARKILPALFAAPLPARLKWEGALHLTANAAYPLLLVLSLALPVVLGAPPIAGPVPVWALQVALLLAGLVPVAAFLARSQSGERVGVHTIAHRVASAMVLCTGLCLNNSRAVLEGLAGPVGNWERTPKTGERGASGAVPTRRSVPATVRPAGRSELALAALFAAAFATAATAGELRALPFLAVLVAGFAWVGAAALAPALRRPVAR